jgi:hypothetical protein
MHFGPLITTPTDDIDERDDDNDDDDDDNGWFVGGVTTRSPTLIPPGTPYPSPLEQPTPPTASPTVSSSDSGDVEVKATVDGGHIAAAAAEKNLHTKPKVSQSRCGLVLCSPIYVVCLYLHPFSNDIFCIDSYLKETA